MPAPIDELLAVDGPAARSGARLSVGPWQQSFASIAPYTVEEAYEVADAIERGDMADLKDELGDLLLQVVFHSRMAEETGRLRLRRRRQGHLSTRWCAAIPTSSAAGPSRAEASLTRRPRPPIGRARKAAERAAKGARAGSGVLDDVPVALPGSHPRGEADQARRPGRLRLAGCRRPCSTSCARRRLELEVGDRGRRHRTRRAGN